MKTKSPANLLFVLAAVTLFFLSTAEVVAIIDLSVAPGGPAIQAAGLVNQEHKPKFISNVLLVKLTAQARGTLKVAGEEVNPAGTGLPTVDLICRGLGVNTFRSIMPSGAHRNPGAAINSWYKLTLP